MNRENRLCALCDEFHTKDATEPGMGACHAYKASVPSITAFVPWDGKFCVLFRKAADPDRIRERYVAKQMAKQQEAA